MRLQIEKWERWFLYATIVVLVAFFVAIIGSIGEAGIHLPTDADQVDPLAFSDADPANPAPFDQLGVFPADDDPDVDLRVIMLARAWAFEPSTVEIPKGSTVEFVVTSADTIHGFLIADVAVNAMVIPGQITKVTATFDEAGTHQMICHEFCGLNHHNMFGIVEVTE